MARKITNNNYTATCAELICAFAAAIKAERMDSDDKDVAGNGALELAKSCGWDWEADKSYADWALRATGEESLVEGLREALSAVRVQHEAQREAFIAQHASKPDGSEEPDAWEEPVRRTPAKQAAPLRDVESELTAVLDLAAFFQDDYSRKLPVIAAFRRWRGGHLSTEKFLSRLKEDDLADVLRYEKIPPMEGLSILNGRCQMRR